ncbi:MAG: GNAT family N-acetyltransferase [Rhodobacteraceae bacterium]|nr:GNAT family N-acetyltransferase [Paracoccaceae bacterium]
MNSSPASDFDIVGYRPGALGWAVQTQAQYYADAVGFNDFFEAKIASEAAAFLPRRDQPGCGFFLAVDGEDWLGSVVVDHSSGVGALAKLRWFIVAPLAQGRGVGAALLERAIATVRESDAGGVMLETFAGLEAARKLYERAGFQLVEERAPDSNAPATWGTPVREQRFELRFHGAGV